MQFFGKDTTEDSSKEIKISISDILVKLGAVADIRISSKGITFNVSINPGSTITKEPKPLPKEAETEAKPLPKEAEAEAKPLPKEAEAEAKPLPKEAEAEAKPLPKVAETETKPLPKEEAKPLPKEEAKPLPKEAEAEAKPLPKEEAKPPPKEEAKPLPKPPPKEWRTSREWYVQEQSQGAPPKVAAPKTPPKVAAPKTPSKVAAPKTPPKVAAPKTPPKVAAPKPGEESIRFKVAPVLLKKVDVESTKLAENDASKTEYLHRADGPSVEHTLPRLYCGEQRPVSMIRERKKADILSVAKRMATITNNAVVPNYMRAFAKEFVGMYEKCVDVNHEHSSLDNYMLLKFVPKTVISNLSKKVEVHSIFPLDEKRAKYYKIKDLIRKRAKGKISYRTNGFLSHGRIKHISKEFEDVYSFYMYLLRTAAQ